MERRERAYRPHHIGYDNHDKRRVYRILDLIATGNDTRDEIEAKLRELPSIKEREKGLRTERYAIEVLYQHPLIKRVRHCTEAQDHEGLDLEITPDAHFMRGVEKHYAQIKSSRAYQEQFKASTKYQKLKSKGILVAAFNANTRLTPMQVLHNYLEEMQNLLPGLDVTPWLEVASTLPYFVDKGH